LSFPTNESPFQPDSSGTAHFQKMATFISLQFFLILTNKS